MPLQCVRIAMADIQNEFSPLLKTEDGRWVCNGLRKEQEKQKLRRQKAKENADARWNHADASNPHSKKNADASNPQCFPTPTPTPTPSNTLKSEKDAEALAIYQAYPLKVNKPAALKAITKALKDTEVDKLLAITRRFALARPPGTPYTPHPATWFNGRCFEDDPATWASGDSKQVPPPTAAEFSPGWENKNVFDMTEKERLQAMREGNA
jgi:hypothetical protein